MMPSIPSTIPMLPRLEWTSSEMLRFFTALAESGWVDPEDFVDAWYKATEGPIN